MRLTTLNIFKINHFDFNFIQKNIIRIDFNVPLDENFNVTDTSRIVAAKPTIDKILAEGGSVILITSRKTKRKRSQLFIKTYFKNGFEVLGVEVKFATDCIGEVAETAAKNLQPKEVLLLENLRYYAEEEAGDVDFAKKLASLGDIYVMTHSERHIVHMLQQRLLLNFFQTANVSDC